MIYSLLPAVLFQFFPGSFQNTIAQLNAIGLTDVLLPFFLIFTIVYAILQQTKILGENSKNFNVIIALVMGFAVVIPHIMGGYPFGFDVVDVLNRALAHVSLVLIAIFMVLVLIGVFGWKVGGEHTSIQGWLALIMFLLVVYIFGAAANLWHMPTTLNFLLSPDTRALTIVLFVFGLVVWFITIDDETTLR